METISTNFENVDIGAFADTCPHCHHAILPTFIAATLDRQTDHPNRVLDIAFRCTRLQCSRLFISTYKRNINRQYFFQKSVPLNYLPPALPKEVKEVSPDFEIILGQAGRAEADGLDQIAGVGYRKALEFLIKDFCVSKHQNKDNAIKKAPLGQVIDNYIDAPKIKELAKRAVWLGNDETHYVRKWENKDINHLKSLIHLTTAFIEQDIASDRLITEMATPAKDVVTAK